MQNCNSCGKPILNPMDLSLGNTEKGFCRLCVDELGELKSYEEIFANQVGLLMTAESLTQDEAAQKAKEQLAKTEIWKNHQ